MKNKLFGILFCSILVISLTGCGSKNSNNGGLFNLDKDLVSEWTEGHRCTQIDDDEYEYLFEYTTYERTNKTELTRVTFSIWYEEYIYQGLLKKNYKNAEITKINGVSSNGESHPRIQVKVDLTKDGLVFKDLGPFEDLKDTSWESVKELMESEDFECYP